MPEYDNHLLDQGQRIDDEATGVFTEGSDDRAIAEDYVRNSLLLAMVLVLIAMAQRFRVRQVRIAVLIVASVLIAFVLATVVRYPRLQRHPGHGCTAGPPSVTPRPNACEPSVGEPTAGVVKLRFPPTHLNRPPDPHGGPPQKFPQLPQTHNPQRCSRLRFAGVQTIMRSPRVRLTPSFGGPYTWSDASVERSRGASR